MINKKNLDKTHENKQNITEHKDDNFGTDVFVEPSENDDEQEVLRTIENTALYKWFRNDYELYVIQIIGVPTALVDPKFDDSIANVTLDIKSYQIQGSDSKTLPINWEQFRIGDQKPEYFENNMENYPFMVYSTEESAFIEENIDMGNGHIVDIKYKINPATSYVDRIEVSELH